MGKADPFVTFKYYIHLDYYCLWLEAGVELPNPLSTYGKSFTLVDKLSYHSHSINLEDIFLIDMDTDYESLCKEVFIFVYILIHIDIMLSQTDFSTPVTMNVLFNIL